MLYSLTGTVRTLTPPQLTVTVSGVEYLVSVPHPMWEKLEQGAQARVVVYTYVREDRLDLYGFESDVDRLLFAELINLSGVGPKLALELCSIPKSILTHAIAADDAQSLTQMKGVGAKTAEKLLLELKSLAERHPELWSHAHDGGIVSAPFDADALAALTSLGYDQRQALEELRKLPADLTRTEDRVAAILRSLSTKPKPNVSRRHSPVKNAP